MGRSRVVVRFRVRWKDSRGLSDRTGRIAVRVVRGPTCTSVRLRSESKGSVGHSMVRLHSPGVSGPGSRLIRGSLSPLSRVCQTASRCRTARATPVFRSARGKKRLSAAGAGHLVPMLDDAHRLKRRLREACSRISARRGIPDREQKSKERGTEGGSRERERIYPEKRKRRDKKAEKRWNDLENARDRGKRRRSSCCVRGTKPAGERRQRRLGEIKKKIKGNARRWDGETVALSLRCETMGDRRRVYALQRASPKQESLFCPGLRGEILENRQSTDCAVSWFYGGFWVLYFEYFFEDYVYVSRGRLVYDIYLLFIYSIYNVYMKIYINIGYTDNTYTPHWIQKVQNTKFCYNIV